MRYQHPEIEIVRTALNLGTGSITVTKPCSHTPCAGSFVATIQFLGHTGWNGEREVRALVYASVRNARDLPSRCHRKRSSWGFRNWSFRTCVEEGC